MSFTNAFFLRVILGDEDLEVGPFREEIAALAPEARRVVAEWLKQQQKPDS